ncbi:hypothetical protein B7R54_03910 [Subtercola boreus]|uniref:Glycerophosphoryl diester phosphodiesterase membrane domain-containing protein n=1 Tax=Subtercola boreus TaxID=120213 RepID=A0A3E0VFZ1_9MICO|nr:hypothetical protein [Subtercola boreus]RFA08463.1 hypothetical protein B7R54_03910 [Subtercola boreus]TQL54618.1 hypothetical protein FB464_2160 [Subtercola boreus]
MTDNHDRQGAGVPPVESVQPPRAFTPPQYGQYAPQPGYGANPTQPGYGANPTQPGPGQWAPPPKPGLVPLRPLGFGTLLGAPFQVLRRNPRATLGSALIIQFVIGVVTALIVGGAVLLAVTRIDSASQEDYDSIQAGSTAIVLLSTLIPLAVALVTSALLQSILVIEVSREILGEKRRMGELWRAAGRRIWPLALWTLLQVVVAVLVLAAVVGVIVLLTLLGTVGAVLAVVFGIVAFLGIAVLAAWLTTKLSLVPCVIVLERAGVRAAIARSWRLTDRFFWRTLGTEWLVGAIVSVASQVVVQPISLIFGLGVGVLAPNGTDESGTGSGLPADLLLIGGLYLVIGIIQLVFGAISSVVQAATVSVIYVDLRIRKEGLDLELIRFVEARESGRLAPDEDPFRVAGRV